MIAIRMLFRSQWAAYLLYGLALLAVLLLAWTSAQSSIIINNLPERSYNSYHCDTVSSGEAQPEDTFRILDLFILDADTLVNALCQDPLIARHYRRVEVSWMHRDQVDLRSLFNQQYEVMFSKPEMLKRIETSELVSYSTLAKYSDYASQLISLHSVPELSNDYFRGKRLGLIDDPNSRSGYLIPKKVLKEASIDESLFDIVLYKSHDQLHRALLLGEVEMIASFAPITTVRNTTARKSLLLQEKLLGPRWYLQTALLQSDAHCQLAQHLRVFASQHVNPYIQNMTIVRGCKGEP